MPLYTAKAEEQVGLVRIGGSKLLAAPGRQKLLRHAHGIAAGVRQPIHIWTAKPDAWTTFTGPLIITPTAGNTFSLAREMLLEDYLRNVVPAEMPASFHPQALRAQAIIARTYALIEMGRHADEGADVCSDQQPNVLPDAKRTAVADNAVTETRELVLILRRPVGRAVLSCRLRRGDTDDAGVLWGPERARPYLAGIVDAPGGKTAAGTDDSGPADGERPLLHRRQRAALDTHLHRRGSGRTGKPKFPAVTGDATVQLSKVTALSIEERTPMAALPTCA